ncbi:MAG: hypothetical protein ACQKBY_08260, partial [Verrucomicrobiales bacterium]
MTAELSTLPGIDEKHLELFEAIGVQGYEDLAGFDLDQMIWELEDANAVLDIILDIPEESQLADWQQWAAGRLAGEESPGGAVFAPASVPGAEIWQAEQEEEELRKEEEALAAQKAEEEKAKAEALAAKKAAEEKAKAEALAAKKAEEKKAKAEALAAQKAAEEKA